MLIISKNKVIIKYIICFYQKILFKLISMDTENDNKNWFKKTLEVSFKDIKKSQINKIWDFKI
jgi:hypothetical protein|tara:strand:+ start:91 stop:279 length:189 start_codon:yes stop_codon:yes gene_type:complete